MQMWSKHSLPNDQGQEEGSSKSKADGSVYFRVRLAEGSATLVKTLFFCVLLNAKNCIIFLNGWGEKNILWHVQITWNSDFNIHKFLMEDSHAHLFT